MSEYLVVIEKADVEDGFPLPSGDGLPRMTTLVRLRPRQDED